MTDQELRAQVAQTEQASVELHAAMLKFDTQLGLLRMAVEERALEDYQTSVLSAFSVRHDRIGAIA